MLVFQACRHLEQHNPEVFAYIEQHGLIPDEYALSETLCHTGCEDNLPAVQRLRRLGAPWPDVLENDMGAIWHGESLFGSERYHGGGFNGDEFGDSEDDFDYEEYDDSLH
jgi:hypothetical protein